MKRKGGIILALLCVFMLTLSGCEKEKEIQAIVKESISAPGQAGGMVEKTEKTQPPDRKDESQIETLMAGTEEGAKEGEGTKESKTKGDDTNVDTGPICGSVEESKKKKENLKSSEGAKTNTNTKTNAKANSKTGSLGSNGSDTSPSSPVSDKIVSNPPAEKSVHTTCTWNNGQVTQAASCSSAGSKTYTCTVCGKTRTESIAQTGHNYVTDSKAATCTVEGYTKTTCSMCGAVQSESKTPATGHDYQKSWYPEPTCTRGGYCTLVCTKCKDTLSHENVPALGHVSDGGKEVEHGDCLGWVVVEYHCTVCYEKIDEDRHAGDHSWVTGIVDDKEKTYCSVCLHGQ